MSKRRKRRVKEVATQPPELTGIARLLSEMPEATLDLHGYTGPQARLRVRDFLTTHSRISAGSVVHVITGKGTGSTGEGVLLELTRDLLEGEAENHVDEYAGMLGGGGWVVRVK
jgi:DNA-nicking Smr family endonuclease